MKKILWTTIFWLVIALGFAFYMKSFDANMANGVATRLGATEIVSQDTLATTGTESSEVMSGINAIQTTLADMQKALEKISGTETTSTITTPTPVVEEKPVPTTAE